MFRLIILPHMVRFANTRVAGNCPENYIEKYLVMSHLLMLKMPHSLKKKIFSGLTLRLTLNVVSPLACNSPPSPNMKVRS